MEWPGTPIHDDWPGTPVSDAPSTSTTTTPTTTGRSSLNTGGNAARALGAAAGGLVGGPPGALMGMGLAGTAADLYEGKADWKRGAVQTLGAAGAQAAFPQAGVGLRVARGALSTAIAGQLYDAASNWWTGKKPTLGATAERVGSDVVAGAVGEGINETMTSRAAARDARRAETQAHIATRRQQFEDIGVTPKASELTDSPLIEGLEDAPRGALTGSKRTRQFEVAREGEKRAAVESRVRGISPQDVQTPRDAADIMASGFSQEMALAEQAKRQAYRATEAVTGDTPVIPVTNFLPALQNEVRIGEGLPSGPLRGSARIAGRAEARVAGAPQPRPTGLLDAQGAPLMGQTDPLDAVADAMVRQFGISPATARQFAEAAPDGRMPFWMARDLESQLGAMTRGPTFGNTPQQAAAKRLYGALKDDMRSFYESSEQGGTVNAGLRAANEHFKRWQYYENESKLKVFAGRADSAARMRAAFQPGNADVTAELRDVLPAETFDAGVQGWARGLYDKHAQGKPFNSAGFAKDIRDFDKNGQLDLLLGPERAAQFRRLAEAFTPSQSIMQRSSGTTERGIRGAQLFGLGTMTAEFLRALATGNLPAAGGALAGAAFDLGAPAALSRLTTTPGGINFLTRSAVPLASPSMALRRGLGQVAGSGVLP